MREESVGTNGRSECNHETRHPSENDWRCLLLQSEAINGGRMKVQEDQDIPPHNLQLVMIVHIAINTRTVQAWLLKTESTKNYQSKPLHLHFPFDSSLVAFFGEILSNIFVTMSATKKAQLNFFYSPTHNCTLSSRFQKWYKAQRRA